MVRLKEDQVSRILHLTEELSHIHDLDALLDRVLLVGRSFTGANCLKMPVPIWT